MKPIISSRFYNKPGQPMTPDFGHPLMQGLISWWPLLENAGSQVYDYSGNNNIATLTNMAPSLDWTPGNPRFGGLSLDFDGSDDRVRANRASRISGANGGAFSLWTKRLGNGSGGNIIISHDNDGDPNRIRMTANTGAWDISLGGTNNALTGGTLSLNIWHHLVLTWNTTTYFVYQDGVQIATGSASVGALTQRLIIGAYGDGTSNHYQGMIENVMIYNRLLLGAEVMQHYISPWQVFKRNVLWANNTGGVTPVAQPASRSLSLMGVGN